MGNSVSTRTALVTGANRGLGLETCRQLARRGFRVLLMSRAENGKIAAQRLAKEGLAAEYRQLDVVNPASIAALADQLRGEGARLDALVNNAASTRTTSTPRSQERRWRLTSSARCT